MSSPKAASIFISPSYRSVVYRGIAPGQPRSDYNVVMPTTTRIVQIGNSRGIRIPKALLELADLSDEVELHAEPGRLVVRATRRPREGWEAAAQEMRAADDDLLLDPPRPTAFDDEEWEW